MTIDAFGHEIDRVTLLSTSMTRRQHRVQVNELPVSTSKLSILAQGVIVPLVLLPVEVSVITCYRACVEVVSTFTCSSEQTKENEALVLPGLGLEKEMIEKLNDGRSRRNSLVNLIS